MKSIDKAQLAGKRVLVRVDYNIPLNEQLQATDVTRISRTKKTIDKIVSDGGTAILMSHLGRPKGAFNEAYSLKNLVKTVSDILGYPVIFGGDVLSSETAILLKGLPNKSVVLLENLRFHKEEEAGDEAFAKAISRLGDLYVNDAFGTAHREHASTATIARFFKNESYAGYLLYDEIIALEKALTNPQRPFTAIIGGSKVSSKLNILKNLVEKVDSLIVAGAMSYTFLAALGVKIGNSLYEPERIDDAKSIIKQAHRLGVDFYVPLDNVCGMEFTNETPICITTNNDIPEGWEGMDIGEKTIKKFSTFITHSKTILWNGPLGVFEFDNFNKGTKSIAVAVAATTLTGAFSLIGGGDSIAAINKYGLSDFISYVSTGGGAMLEYLEGLDLPGIKALNED